MKKKISLSNIEIELSKEELEKALKEFDEPEFDYPICCKSKHNGEIVLFDEDVNFARCLEPGDSFSTKGRIGAYGHPADSTTWEQIPYDKERGFYHKQLVYAWDDKDTHQSSLRFYDAINKCCFSYAGKFYGWPYNNYSATMPEHMNEFKEVE